MPAFGGVIGVGIGAGLDKYPSNEPVNGKDIGEYQKSRKSFFVYKVDNVDFSAKDLRILNAFGKPSHEGRIEIRLNGRWGTICSKKI